MVASLEFVSLYDHPNTTVTGRARLLDGSVARGPFAMWRRIPVTAAKTEQGSSVPLSTNTPLFAFDTPSHFPVALATQSWCSLERLLSDQLLMAATLRLTHRPYLPPMSATHFCTARACRLFFVHGAVECTIFRITVRCKDAPTH